MNDFQRYGLSLLILLLLGCASGEPVVDEQDILRINASPATIFNFGDVSTITITLTHADGRPVPDGARVLLTSNGGAIDSEVRVTDGRAQIPFFSDALVGTVTITAQSGQLGLEGDISTEIEVLDRAVEVGGIAMNLNPSNITTRGGDVLINATVFDPNGAAIPDKVVVFSSEYGSLASNGAPRRTDSSGRASDLLSLENLPSDLNAVEVTAETAGVTTSRTLSVTTNESPLAVIGFSPENPRVGDVVSFNGQQSSDPDGEVVRWQWDFGEGVTAEGIQAQHTFRAARTHLVTLQVTDNLGAVHAVTQAVTAGENALPTADFSISPENPRVGELVTLDGALSTDTDGSVSSYSWTLGNGVTRTGRTVTYSYGSARTYAITLEVEDNDGGRASVSKTITVEGNTAPTATISASKTTAGIGERIFLDGTGSSDTDGIIEVWEWDLGNGITASDPQTSITYGNPGDYLITLLVTDNEGATGFASQLVTISDNLPPSASFTFSPTSPRVDQLVVFDAAGSQDTDGEIVAWRWNFGDGSFGSGKTVQHRYQAAFTYQVSLEVEDNRGATAVFNQGVTVTDGGIPNAVLNLSPTTISPDGGQILLDASNSTDLEDSNQLRYFFSISNVQGVSIQHSGPENPIAVAVVPALPDGTRLIFELVVADTEGNQDLDAATVTVTDSQTPQAPVASFTVSPSQLNVDGGFVVLDASGTTDSDTLFDDLTFDYSAEIAGQAVVDLPPGDGFLRNVGVTSQPGFPIGPNDQVVFVLVVSDPTGLISRTTRTLSFTEGASNTAPVAVLKVTPSSAVPAAPPTATLLLDASDSVDNEDGEPVGYEFSATNSNGSTVKITRDENDRRLAFASVEDAAPGDFIVITLEVFDSQGASDKVSVSLPVTN